MSRWISAYKIHLLSDTDVTFVLTSGGHNACIVSEPRPPRMQLSDRDQARERHARRSRDLAGGDPYARGLVVAGLGQAAAALERQGAAAAAQSPAGSPSRRLGRRYRYR
jgi:hypothetical protein